MKKKFGLCLNIVTICLCVCAIAIGVYAATSATLTVSGQIGFEAHGCTGTVSGTIVGHAQGDDKNAMPTTTPVSLGDAVNFGQTLSYGTSRYFTDMATTDGSVTPITIVLTVTNTSLFPIEGQVVLPETDFAKAIDFDVECGLVQLAATTPSDDNTDVGTITITMTLKETTTNYETPVALNFTIEFNKYTQIKGDATEGYYVTMGSNVVTDANGVQQVEAVKWIPFAEQVITPAAEEGGEDTISWTAFDNKNKPNEEKQYYFISEKILDVGKDYDNVVHDGVNFVDSDSEYTDLSYNNYIKSKARNFLKSTKNIPVSRQISSDHEVEYVNLLSEYGLTGYLYNKITPRKIKDLYEGDKAGNTFESISSNATYSALITGENEKDKLWILSKSEAESFFETEERIAKTFHENLEASYWLRSPDLTIPSYITMYYHPIVQSNGTIYTSLLTCFGIRPAFQLDLAI